MRPSPSLLATLLVLLLTAGIPAQGLTLTSTSLEAGQIFSASLGGGPPGQLFVVGIDVSSGPTVLSGLGTVALGITPALFLVDWLSFDVQGRGGFSSVVHNAPGYVGNMVYAQAACADAGSAQGCLISNPLARGIHPPPPPPGTITSLSLGEDTSEVLPLPFAAPFPFYGSTFTSVGVSSNGLLTFGGISNDPTEQISDFLAGLPKIAVLWDDLSPQVQGGVQVESSPDHFTVIWGNVPQFYVLDHNWASVTLHSDGTVSVSWPQVDLEDSLVGIGPGSWLGSPTFVDFSRDLATGESLGAGPLLEQFLPCCNPFDLGGSRITFLPQAAGGTYRWIR